MDSTQRIAINSLMDPPKTHMPRRYEEHYKRMLGCFSPAEQALFPWNIPSSGYQLWRSQQTFGPDVKVVYLQAAVFYMQMLVHEKNGVVELTRQVDKGLFGIVAIKILDVPRFDEGIFPSLPDGDTQTAKYKSIYRTWTINGFTKQSKENVYLFDQRDVTTWRRVKNKDNKTRRFWKAQYHTMLASAPVAEAAKFPWRVPGSGVVLTHDKHNIVDYHTILEPRDVATPTTFVSFKAACIYMQLQKNAAGNVVDCTYAEKVSDGFCGITGFSIKDMVEFNKGLIKAPYSHAYQRNKACLLEWRRVGLVPNGPNSFCFSADVAKSKR